MPQELSSDHVPAHPLITRPAWVSSCGDHLSNFLLVTGKTPDDDPLHAAPDMAAEIARRPVG
jgi:hypothetical protein